ncbi:MAG TPA: putative glycoside hydrolase, partial [Longimicrobiales bacterium]|nr:putative glycoside hydrolase [Longimicrobiales bacterium]
MKQTRRTVFLAVLLATAACAGDKQDSNSQPAPAPADSTTTSNGSPTPPAAGAPKDAPAQIRGIYLNAYAVGSSKRLATLLKMADETEINAFVVDVKDEKGIRYHTALAHQKQIGGEITIKDLKTLVDTIHAHKVWTMARIVVFKDPMLSKAKPEWSIKNPNGGLWQDKAGNTWVSAWDPHVWEYNIQIAEEVLKAGFDEVQFDYVRFPEPFPSLPKQVHPQAKGERVDAIASFLSQAEPRIHALGGVMSADLFGLSPDDPGDVNIGQQWERLINILDHVLPMTYPSHYLATHLRGVPKPNQMPYETIVASVGLGVIRAERLKAAGGHPARVIPWLQAFSAPWVTRNYPYGPEQAAAQIRGVYEVGLEDWVFWHPGSKYELVSAAFAKETAPRAKEFTPSADLVSQVDLLERQGVKSSRDKA